ncbi:MAG: hypothetical protein LBL63_00845 [Clostridiales Family XIII bacterium]|jgi:hypothetical protein|nr:hypothetical protein [Clostridiales Family XIII bacterium]
MGEKTPPSAEKNESRIFGFASVDLGVVALGVVDLDVSVGLVGSTGSADATGSPVPFVSAGPVVPA